MIRDVLLEQKRELELRLAEPYVEREFPQGSLQDTDLITVIIGPRRAGKSFFATRLVAGIGDYGYVNFDDERLAEVSDFDVILQALDDLYGRPKHLLLDEIQNKARWELMANRLQRQGRRLYLTGSNSNMLSTELATHLTGRHRLILVFPFSFRETLRLEKQELTEIEQQSRLERYMRRGGFPEPWVKNLEQTEYLRTLINSVLYKDIVKRFRIRALQGLEDLAYYLFSNVGKEVSYQTLARVTRCRSVHTVEKYLRYMEEAFLFFTIRRFSLKVREQAAANKKIYCVDNGMATSLGFRFSPDAGRLLENLVAVILRKKEVNNLAQVFFWRNPQNEEVDFVVREGLKVTGLIQVCKDLSDPKTRNREIRALLKASSELKCRNLLVLTESTEGKETAEWFGIRGSIRFLPVYSWLREQV